VLFRSNALRDGLHAATLLSAPYNIIAKNQGFTEFVKATDAIGAYQGNVAAVRRPWAQQNRSKVLAYIRGYRESIAWLYEPSNRVEAIAILRRHLPQMRPEIAEASYAELLDPVNGFFRTGDIDREGLACVLELRSRYGRPSKLLNDPDKYCDLSYGEIAT
jgi:hypothetical protein